jgi:hypothetical protein
VRVNAGATYATLGVFSRCDGFSVPLNDPGTGGTSGVPARGTTASRAFSSIYDAYHCTEMCAELRTESPVRRMFRFLRPFFRENSAAWELLGSLGAYELLFAWPVLFDIVSRLCSSVLNERSNSVARIVTPGVATLCSRKTHRFPKKG